MITMTDYPKQTLAKFIPRASIEALNLMEWMM
jgi:hypothetical protein